MNGKVERKMIEGTANVDTTSRKVVVEISSMGDVDLSDDVFLPTAWNRTISDRGPKGSNEIWHLLDHEDGIKRGALSKPEEIYVKNNKLVYVTPYRDTYNWRDVAWPLYVSGDINQHSAGFITIKSHEEYQGSKKIRVIEEAMLFEGSCVLWGDNRNTQTQAVLKSWLDSRDKSRAIPDKLNSIYEGVKNGEFDAENLSLLKLEIKYLEQTYLELEEKANQAFEKKKIDAAAEEKNRLAGILKQINSQLQLN